MTNEPNAKAEAKAEPTLEELMAQLAVASTEGNLTEIIRLGNAIKKHQSEIAKAEAERIAEENEALAGDREKLATELWNFAKTFPNLLARLEAVKAQGFTFKLDTAEVKYKSVALTVPVAKTKTVRGGNGGSTSKLKEQTGLSRSEIIEKYATDRPSGEIFGASSLN